MIWNNLVYTKAAAQSMIQVNGPRKATQTLDFRCVILKIGYPQFQWVQTQIFHIFPSGYNWGIHRYSDSLFSDKPRLSRQAMWSSLSSEFTQVAANFMVWLEEMEDPRTEKTLAPRRQAVIAIPCFVASNCSCGRSPDWWGGSWFTPFLQYNSASSGQLALNSTFEYIWAFIIYHHHSWPEVVARDMSIILQKQVEECPPPQEPVIDFLYKKGMKTCTPRPT